MNRDRFGIQAGLRKPVILLSASIIEQEKSTVVRDYDERATEEAVISLARAAFAHGFSLVYIGRPDIALLLAAVYGEYRNRLYAESTNMRHDADEATGEQLFEAFVTRQLTYELRLEEDLDFIQRHGLVSLHWIEDIGRELSGITRRVQPDALVCIGGDEDTRAITTGFREIQSQAQIFAMTTTGAVSEQLHRQMPNVITPYDLNMMDQLRGILREAHVEGQSSLYVQGIPPYPLIMQQLVHELASRSLH